MREKSIFLLIILFCLFFASLGCVEEKNPIVYFKRTVDLNLDSNTGLDLNTMLDGRYLFIDGSNANQTIDIGSENITTTGSLTGNSLKVNATSDHSISDSSDDLLIKNFNSNKSIIFNVNDGGTAKDFFSVEAHGSGVDNPRIYVDTGTITVSGTYGIVEVAGTIDPSIIGSGMYFHPANSGAGTLIGLYSAPTIALVGTSRIEGYRADIQNNTDQNSGTQTIIGFRDTGLMIPGSGTANKTSFSSDGVSIVQTTAGTRNKTGLSLTAGTALTAHASASVSQQGIVLSGWGNGTNISGTLRQNDIWSNGGDTYFGGTDNNFHIEGKLVVGNNTDANLTTGDINARAIFYDLLISKSPAIFCDTQDKCMVIDFNNKTINWCDRNNGGWQCDIPNKIITNKLVARDIEKQNWVLYEQAKKNCDLNQNNFPSFTNWINGATCSFNEAKAKETCEKNEAMYWDSKAKHCFTNPYRECVIRLVETHEWNFNNNSCEISSRKTCINAGHDWDAVNSVCIQNPIANCLKQPHKKWENGQCLDDPISLCLADKSKIWKNGNCENAN